MVLFIIIDCDLGYDDVIVFVFVFVFFELEVKVIIFFVGNQMLEKILCNVLWMLILFKCLDILVVGGVVKFFMCELIIVDNVYGESGFDGLVLFELLFVL